MRRVLVAMLLFVGMCVSGTFAQTTNASAAELIDAIDAAPTVAARAVPRERIVDWPGLIRFFAPGLIVAAAIGASGGVLGTFVALRRDALLALALPQVVALGAAVGMRTGWSALPPALAFVAAALGYVTLTRRGGPSRRATMTIPAIYVAGLCLSFLAIAHGGQHVEELQSLFTGIDVAVTPSQAAFAAPVLLVAAVACATLWRRWLLIAQAPATAELAGVSVARWDAAFLALLAVVLLVGTSVQGTVLVLTMLFLPPAIVEPWTRRIPPALAAAVVASWLCLAVAFVASVNNEWPLSHSVGGVAFAALVASRAIRAAIRRG